MLFCHSLLESKPVGSIWVRCMVTWLTITACQWAKLIGGKHPFIKNQKVVGAMLMWLYQARLLRAFHRSPPQLQQHAANVACILSFNSKLSQPALQSSSDRQRRWPALQSSLSRQKKLHALQSSINRQRRWLALQRQHALPIRGREGGNHSRASSSGQEKGNCSRTPSNGWQDGWCFRDPPVAKEEQPLQRSFTAFSESALPPDFWWWLYHPLLGFSDLLAYKSKSKSVSVSGSMSRPITDIVPTAVLTFKPVLASCLKPILALCSKLVLVPVSVLALVRVCSCSWVCSMFFGTLIQCSIPVQASMHKFLPEFGFIINCN